MGEAGAGKTVLANQLLIDVITSLPATDPSPGTPLRIPVRLSLPAFKPGADSIDADAGALATRLDAWIARHLTTVYGLAPATARALVDGGWILPILDGLDEMDPAAGPPIRAAAVTRALNHPAGPALRPVVLTCRTASYQHITSATAAGPEDLLQDATAVRIQPLTAARVIAYLTYRFPDPARPRVIQPRWQAVVDHVSGDHRSPLATTLASPLHLFMAVTAYQYPDTTPADLTCLSAPELLNRLLTGLLPALTTRYPRPGGGTYRPADVARWLTTLACHLHTQQVRYGGPGSDIHLHELWAVARERTVRYLAAAALTLLAGIPLADVWHSVGWGGAANVTLAMMLAGGVFLVARRRRIVLNRFDPSQLRTRAGTRSLARGFAYGFIAGLLPGWAYGFAAGIAWGLRSAIIGGLAWSIAVGLAAGLAGGLSIGLTKRPEAIHRPGDLVTQGVARDIVIWITSGLAVASAQILAIAIAIAVPFGLAAGFAAGFAIGLGTALPHGLAFGFGAGALWTANSPWLRYFFACRILTFHDDLPSRPARFLNWAYAAGLIRLSGISAQFRHRELQFYFMRLGPAFSHSPERSQPAPADLL